MPIYADVAAPKRLPPASSTDGQVFSVPRLSGGYDYYQGPPGTAVPWNDDGYRPNVAHPNAIGVSSLTVGCPLPEGAQRIGSGFDAIGCITPLPGAGSGPLPSGLAGVSGLGELTLPGGELPSPLALGGAAALALLGAYLLWRR